MSRSVPANAEEEADMNRAAHEANERAEALALQHAIEKRRGKPLSPELAQFEESDFADGSPLAQQLAPRAKAYTFALVFGSTKYFCIEAGDGVYNRCAQSAQQAQQEQTRTQREMEATARELSQLQAQPLPAELEAEETEGETSSPLAQRYAEEDALHERLRGLGDRLVELSKQELLDARDVVEACVRGWENATWPKPAPPCNTPNKAQLSPTRASQIATAILERGIKGRSDAAFLASL